MQFLSIHLASGGAACSVSEIAVKRLHWTVGHAQIWFRIAGLAFMGMDFGILAIHALGNVGLCSRDSLIGTLIVRGK